MQFVKADEYFQYCAGVVLPSTISLEHFINCLWAQEHLDREMALSIILEAQLSYDKTQVQYISLLLNAAVDIVLVQSDPASEFNLTTTRFADDNQAGTDSFHGMAGTFVFVSFTCYEFFI